jgi:hypothetical protein
MDIAKVAVMARSAGFGVAEALPVVAALTVIVRVTEVLYQPESFTKNLAMNVPELLYACHGLMEWDGVAQVPSPQHQE